MLNVFGLTICSGVFLFIFVWHFFCCCTCSFIISFSFVVVSIFSLQFMRFFCFFLLILLSLCLCSLLPAFAETNCSLKKNSFYNHIVFQGLSKFLCSMFGDLLKCLLLHLQFLLIYYFNECCLFVERLLRCGNWLALGFCCLVVALRRAQYLT